LPATQKQVLKQVPIPMRQRSEYSTLANVATNQFPTEDYLREPEQPFQASDTLFRLDQLSSFYCAPGEFGHLLEGQRYGFGALTLIVTETHPGGGPPLHVHECEEAHILLEGRTSYVIGGQRFTATAPYVVKIPAGVAHAFLNVGAQPFRMVCAFPDSRFTDVELGPNPLVEKT
jgi:mannose-6-phosphate isomerase-like protein (cupin superfamily)